MRVRKTFVALGALLAAAVLWATVRTPVSPPSALAPGLPTSERARQDQAPPARRDGPVALPALPLRVPRMPRSLDGTDVDGSLTTDDAGHVVASADLRQLFDYFLATLGEIDLAGVRALVEAHARLELRDDDAVAGAMEIFDRYVEYLDALQLHAETATASGDLAGERARVEALQEQVLGPAAAGLFDADNRVTRTVLARHELGPRAGYDGADYDARLERTEEQLPARVRRGLRRGRSIAQVRSEVERVRALGGTEGDVWRVRARWLGADAADRLADLDDRRAAAR